MVDYRVYLLDKNQCILRAEWVFKETLEEAVEQVTVQFQNIPCEIWDGPRRVARVPEIIEKAA